MIRINTKSDPRIAEDFPNDPYSNLTILTETQILNLQSAFLAMDSGYFAKIDPDAQKIDLRHLKEQPLIKVLHSLYGQQLVTNTVAQLVELYPIIAALEIEDYIKTITEEVSNRKDILENLEFLELSFRYKLCWQEVIETHLANKLKMLEDSKKFLQLGKIQNDTFEQLLRLFINRYGERQDKILNSVMENYFNRKKIKPMTYLSDPKSAHLQAIWLKFHHVPLSELTPKSSPTINPNANPYESLMPVKSNSFIANTPVSSSFIGGFPPSAQNTSEHQKIMNKLHPQHMAALEEKKLKVAQMQKQIKNKDTIIEELSQRIESIKTELGFKPELTKPATVRSLLIEADVERVRSRRQSKRLQDLFGQGGIDQHESLSDHRRGSAKDMEGKESKNMHRLGSKNVKKA